MSAPEPGPDDAGSGGAGPAGAGSGGAGPALPPGCRGILVLRALRLGALLAVVALLGLLYVWRREIGLLASHQLLTILACVVIAVCGALVVGSERVERVEAATTGLIAAGTALAMAIHLARAWWADYPRTTVTSPVYLIAAAALLALAALAVVSIALCRARTRLGARRRAPDDPARWRRLHRPDGDERGAGESAPSPSESAALRRGPAARTPTTTGARTPVPLRLTDRALLAVVALLPVLTLTAGALVPTALLDPATRTTAPADSELPARPAVPGGDGEGSKKIDWTYNVGTLLDVAAGTAGPIVLTPEGVTALNGEDGSVRWTYQRRAVYLNEHGGRMTAYDGARALITSPDARHVAVQMQGPALDHLLSQDDPGHLVLTVVLDSVTGEVTAEHRGAEEAEEAGETEDAQHRRTTGTPLQMTDSVAVAGREAFALDGGKTLWTLPEDAFTKDTVGYSGTAGHSTVIVSEDTGCPACEEAPTLRVAPDHDPTATADVTNVLPNLDVNGVTVADGWVARFTDGYSPPRADDGTGSNQEAQAVSIDALASAGETAPVPLGAVNSTVAVASAGSGTLVAASAIAEPRPYDGEMVISGYQVATVLDPATGTATPAAEYPGLAAAEVGLRTRIESTQATTSFVIEPADGGPGASLQVPPGTVLAPQRLAKRQNEKEHKLETPFTDPSLVALASPGATVMVLNASSPGFDSTRIHRLYGIGEQ